MDKIKLLWKLWGMGHNAIKQALWYAELENTSASTKTELSRYKITVTFYKK